MRCPGENLKAFGFSTRDLSTATAAAALPTCNESSAPTHWRAERRSLPACGGSRTTSVRVGEFAAAYPVTIVPPLPAYPLFPILHFSSFRPIAYRVLNRSNRDVLTQIIIAGRLPWAAHPAAPVLRRTPRGHWCAYEAWATPEETRRALQILPAWSDCAARAIIDTRNLEGQAYVAYSVDPYDSDTRGLTFHGYFYETVTQDHYDAPYRYDGDAVQICVFGEPQVECLEEWDAVGERWEKTWTRA